MITTTSAVVTVGVVAGIIAALLIIRYVENKNHSKSVEASGFRLPATAERI